jgi:hypothetical protein
MAAPPHKRRSADADAPVSFLVPKSALRVPRDKIVGFESDLFLRKSEPVMSKKKQLWQLDHMNLWNFIRAPKSRIAIRVQ